MKIILAESAGFCYGVSRAVDIARAAAAKQRNVYTLGELIHNRSIVDELSEKGVSVVESLDEVHEGTVIIRSHGVGPRIYDELNRRSLSYLDATCPNVRSIQKRIEKYYQKGYNIIIVGDRTHPEVIGLNGWCDDSAQIIAEPPQVEELSLHAPICVVSQTTARRSVFREVCDKIRQKRPDAVIFDTICRATSLRQAEVEQLASRVDAMIVIGARHSSNTAKLVELSKIHCARVYLVETANDINKEEFCADEIVGVTAGASTPTQIISEVIRKMDNNIENMENMENLEKSLDNLKQLRTGDIVTGEIIAVNEAEVFVNIGYKSDGVIKKSDYMKDLYAKLPECAAIGDTVEAMIIEMNDGTGNVALSKLKVDEMTAVNEAGEKFKSKETVKGKITKIVKGGVIVDLGFATAFMPGNQYGLKYIEDLNTLLNKEVEGRIIEFDKEKNRIIFSRKVILVEERNKKRAEREGKRNTAFAALALDQIVTAPVKNITDFGLFLDLGGVDGFIHVSDISWRRVSNPKKLYNVGDSVTAKVIDLDEKTYRVKLSIKGLTKEPWTEFTETYRVGDIIDVKIKNLVKFGAFAEIMPMVEGLIHISNMAYEKVTSPESVVKTGDVIAVKIIEIDNENRRVGLSIKETLPAPKRRIERDKVYYKEDTKATMADAFKDFDFNFGSDEE